MATSLAPSPTKPLPGRTQGWRGDTTAFLVGLVAMWAVAGGTVDHFQVMACLVTAIAWTFSDADAAVVALAGAIAVGVIGAIGHGAPASLLPLQHLGDETSILILSAFVIAKAIERCGLAASLADRLLGRQGGRFAYLRLGLASFVATFLVPSTAARASVLLPVVERAVARSTSRGEQRATALMAPLVIVLAAFGSPIAAGANLLAIQLLAAQTGIRLSFPEWVLLAAPYALLCTLLALLLPWLLLRADRRPVEPVAAATTTAQQPSDPARRRVGLVLAGVVVLWCTTGWHPLEPTLVALVGALLVTMPGFGALSLPDALKSLDWPLILLLAASAQIGDVIGASPLVASGVGQAADFVLGLGALPLPVILGALALAAMLAHLVIASRSARAAMMLPAMLAVALPLGVDPVVAALTVTAGTGFCILTPVGSKALLIFTGSGSAAAISRDDLQDVALRLLPLQLGLTVLFAAVIWPALLGGL